MRKTLQILVTLFVALSVHSVVLAQLMPVPTLPYYYEADYSATLQVGVPATGTISADEDKYILNYGPNSPVRGYTVALKEDVKYTICITVRTADGKPANLAPSVALLTADKDWRLENNFWSSSSSSEVYSRVTYTPGADGNYCVLGANCFDGSSIDSVNFSISVYETPDCTLEDAEYTTIGLGENTGTLSFASDSLYYGNSAKFLKVSLKAGETYNINYQLSKKAKGAYGLAPYIAIDGGSSYSNGTDFADSCSVETITITPSADVDCKMAIWNTWGGPIPCEYGYKLTIRQLDKASGLASLDCSTEYTVGSVISGSLNADDKQIYCNDSYYGYAEGYSVNVPDDGNQYAYFFKEESDKSFKRGSVVFFKETFGDGILENSVGYDDPMCMLGNVPAGQYKLALMSDQMNSADYKFAVRKVVDQASDIDFSRKLTIGKSQSEYADPFSTQPFSVVGCYGYISAYSVELEKGVTYRFSTTAQNSSFSFGLFEAEDLDEALQSASSSSDDETKTYSAEFYYTPKASGTYKLSVEFADNEYGFGWFDTPVKYMVEEVSSLADLLNNATELTGTHTAQLDFSKDAQLFDSGLEDIGTLLGKAYKMSLAKGEMLMENWRDDLGYLWFHKDAEGKFQMSYLNGSSNYFYYTADADTVLYFVLAVQPNVSNEKVSMSGFVCKPIEQLLDSAVEVAQLPYTASGMFNVSDKGAQMCVCPSGVPSGGFCGAYKLNIAKGEYVNYSFEAPAEGFYFVYSKVDGEYVMPDFFSGGGVRLGGYDQDITFYVANAINGTMSPYKVAINNDNAITLFELFDGATEIGNFPFYAEGNSAQNSTLTNIKGFMGNDYITYANAYKLSLKAGENVTIDYSSSEDAYMLLYSKNAGGTYEFIDSKDGGNNDSFYGNGEYYDFTAPADMELYIYVAPFSEFYQTNWAFNVVKKQQIKTPVDNTITLFELFDGATEIGNLPFYAEGNSTQNSTLANIREYTAEDWSFDFDYITYANAYKLSLKADEKVTIDYSSSEDAYMLLYSKNAGGTYDFIDSRDGDNYDSFYGNGENYDFTAPADMELYIYVAPYHSMVQTDWAFNVVKDQSDINTPDLDFITLFDLFDGATEIGSVPFYAEGNSADNSTLANIREYTAEYWNHDHNYITYANAYKLSLKAGESVHIDYSSTLNAFMLLYSKNAGGTYDFISSRDNVNKDSFYGNGEYYYFTATTDTTIYIYVAPNDPMVQTNWAFNVVMDQSDIKTPDLDIITLFELFDGATEIGNLPFYAEGNSAQNSTLANIREYTAEYWHEDSDYITYANAYKLSLKAGESVHIDYSSTLDAYMLLYSKNAGGTYEYIDKNDFYDGTEYTQSFYGHGEYYDFTAPTDTTIYIYVAPYDPMVQTDWAFNVLKGKKVPSAHLTFADLLDNATEVDMNALHADGYAMYFGEATELYNTSNYFPWANANNLTTTAVAYKFLVPAGANISLYNLKDNDFEGFYFRKTANGYEYCDRSIEKLMRESAGDTLYVVSLNYAPSTYDYMHVIEVYENVTELKYPDLMFEQEPTKEDVMAVLFENNPYFVNCFGDTVVISMDEIERNGDIKGCNINMANHTVTYHVSYNTSISSPMDRYRYNISEITARFGVPFTLAVSTTGNGTVNSNVSGKYLKDTEVVISAVPAEHYHFVQWSNGSTKATDTIMVVSDTALVAEFAIDTYNVELSAENGTVTGAGEYGYGSAAAIAATPAEGYHFVQWSNGSLKANDTITVVSDTALVAEFAIDTLKVVLNAENGTVTGAGEYGYGSAVKIVATPAEGFHFVQWSNGSLKANDTIVVVSDTALVAEFAAHQYGAWDTTLVATCTTSGLRTHACACGEMEVDTIPAHGHTIVVDSAVAATCSATGLTEGKHCSVCDSVLVAQQVIPMLEHSFTNYIYNNDATTEADGTETAVCDHGCGAADTRTAEGTKLTGIDAMETAEVVIYAHHNVIVVENAETDIYVYEPTGRCVAKRQAESNRIEITMPNQGLYIVKVGAEAKRVFINKN